MQSQATRFRVNGRATLCSDAALLSPSAVEGKPRQPGILVGIDGAYTQCSKACLRSHLWDATRFVDPSGLPKATLNRSPRVSAPFRARPSMLRPMTANAASATACVWAFAEHLLSAAAHPRWLDHPILQAARDAGTLFWMNESPSTRRVAVIGAGMAGISCARRLTDAGCQVHLFDKSRGVGGRMATRRLQWTDRDHQPQQASFDHGTPGFSARSPAFAQFVEQPGLGLMRWQPTLAPGSFQALGGLDLWVATPDMPALCRQLLGEIPITLSCAVDALVQEVAAAPAGTTWRLQRQGQCVGEGFTRVVLALPPAQAAVLLQPHRPDWAVQARRVPMLPCWTLMGVAELQPEAPSWQIAWPQRGPLASIIRNESKPGRQFMPGFVHWVLHATAAWSQTHLEDASEQVLPQLQAALVDWLGHPVSWRQTQVQRWRYASAPREPASSAERCWWDAGAGSSSGLGVCGDWLGGAGVEGAWTSGQALAAAVLA